jgi:hypothetical protein
MERHIAAAWQTGHPQPFARLAVLTMATAAALRDFEACSLLEIVQFLQVTALLVDWHTMILFLTSYLLIFDLLVISRQ